MGWSNYGVTVQAGHASIISLGKETIPEGVLLLGPKAWMRYCKRCDVTGKRDLNAVLYSQYGSVAADFVIR